MTDKTWNFSLKSCRWLSRSRSMKAGLASGFLMLLGLMIATVIYQVDMVNPDAVVVEGLSKDASLTTLNVHQEDEMILSPESKPKVRIFDLILLNDELDILELRMNELHAVVDVFFILEAEYTFSGNPKPLHFRDNETRFRQFRDKVIHITIPPLSPKDEEQYVKDGSWANEKFARNKGFNLAMDAGKPTDGRRLSEGLPESDGDVFMLVCRFYYYSYEYRRRDDWYRPALMRYRGPDSLIFTRPESDPYPRLDKILHIREDNWSDAGRRLRELDVRDTPVFDDQCYHCSWCFPNITQVTNKMRSYSHTEHNQKQYTNRKWILEHFSQGIDLFDRDGETYDYIEDNEDLPQYIRDNFQKVLVYASSKRAGQCWIYRC